MNFQKEKPQIFHKIKNVGEHVKNMNHNSINGNLYYGNLLVGLLNNSNMAFH
jgi:basic membrane lipoprotein Med (substrate-binding protein (PBP1-ABC) superfamily)